MEQSETVELVDNQGGSKYDKSKDLELVKWKVEISKGNAFGVGLYSYDGEAPKMRVRRFYVGKDDGKWHWPKTPEDRFPYSVVVSIVRHAKELEEAWSRWDRGEFKRNTKTKGERQDDPGELP